MAVTVHAELAWEAPPGQTAARQKFVVGPEVGATSLRVGLAVVEPGAGVPPHYHNVEEFTLILEGTATSVVGEDVRQVAAGTTVFVPAGVRHQLTNTGTGPLRTVFGYPAVVVERYEVP